MIDVSAMRSRGSTRAWLRTSLAWAPTQTRTLPSAATLPSGLELDLVARYVDEVPFSAASSYFTADIHLGWKLRQELEVALSGHNLLDAHHREFDPELIDSEPTEIERSGHLTLRWRF